MGRTTWPCRGCGQAQTQEHPNGEEIELRLCAACQEKEEQKEIRDTRRERSTR